MDGMKKIELQKVINSENGINYHRNINLSGYTIYRDKSFISFRLMTVKEKQICVIDYIFITSKKDLIQLLSWCINFWSGNAVKYIYYKEMCAIDEKQSAHPLFLLKFRQCPFRRETVIKHPYQNRR